MKRICAAVAAALSGIILLSGCGGKTYGVYTNIADGYDIKLNNYKLRGGVEPVQTASAPEQAEGGNFKSVGKTFYNIMTADATVVVTDDFTDEKVAEEKFANFTESAREILQSIDASLSVSAESSAVYSFNNAAAGEIIQIDETAYEAFRTALDMYELTQGYYNPAIYYNVEMYGFYEGNNLPQTSEELPSEEKVTAFCELASHFGEILLYSEDGGYFVRKPEAECTYGGRTYSMKIDLGGIGKGYAADRISGLMDEYGYKFGYFDFGSSSMICKNHYKNGNYTIGFRDPRSKNGQPYIEVKTNNSAVSTSADDVKYYTIDGVRYCHIFDPFTGKPVDGEIMSASIIGGSAAEGDALTTAIMAMGVQKAAAFINEKLTDRMVVFCCAEA